MHWLIHYRPRGGINISFIFSALSDERTELSSVVVSTSTGLSDSSEDLAVSIFPLLHAINISEQTEAHSDVRDLGTWRMYHSHMRSHNYKVVTRKVERVPVQPVCHGPVLKISSGHFCF